MIKRALFTTLVLALIVSSCRKDNNNPPDNVLIDEIARDSLYNLMIDKYLWNDLMPVVTKDNYDNPYDLLEAMMYKPVDRYSYIQDYDEFVASMAGDFVGHGILIKIDEDDKARIALIYSRSPLYSQGVRRGWIIKSVNGVDIAPLIISDDYEAYNRVIGESKAGITNHFLFEKPDVMEVAITSTKTEFLLNSVIHYDTLHLSSGITGHLVYDYFMYTQESEAELSAAFAFFKSNNIKDLILDLRYNPGGMLATAQKIASYIAGDVPVPYNAPFIKLIYNNQNQRENSVFPFMPTIYPLSLTRLVVLTTDQTASASESLINGLSAFLDVICIGDTTYGKPVGMRTYAFRQAYYFLPIVFKVANRNDEGDFYDGIPPDKYVIDDIAHDFDDRNELCLKEAIHFLETGELSSKGLYPEIPQPWVSEKPEWIRNGLSLIQ